MCVIAFQWHNHPSYALILVANREERYNRPSMRLHCWSDSPDILAGRDLKAMGTWLGITKKGALAALVNDALHEELPNEKPLSSRGKIVRGFLETTESSLSFGAHLKETRRAFAPYQLLFGNIHEDLFIYENSSAVFKKIMPGTHSIHTPNRNPDRKISSKRFLHEYTKNKKTVNPSELISLFYKLDNENILQESDPSLEFPQTKENDSFGIVSTSAILIDYKGNATFVERKYNKKGMHHDTSMSISI